MKTHSSTSMETISKRENQSFSTKIYRSRKKKESSPFGMEGKNRMRGCRWWGRLWKVREVMVRLAPALQTFPPSAGRRMLIGLARRRRRRQRRCSDRRTTYTGNRYRNDRSFFYSTHTFVRCCNINIDIDKLRIVKKRRKVWRAPYLFGGNRPITTPTFNKEMQFVF